VKRGAKADINMTPLIDVSACAADHLHGDHAARSDGTGRACAAASAAKCAATSTRQDRTVVIIIDRTRDDDQHGAADEQRAWQSADGNLKTRARK